MRKAMLKTLKTACVITTVAGLMTLGARAADPQTTTGTSGYGTTTQSTSGDHAAKSFIKEAFRDNQMEIDLAGIGINKGQQAALKTYCPQIQQNHTPANKDLQPPPPKYALAQ